jgi:hypothetical protein
MFIEVRRTSPNYAEFERPVDLNLLMVESRTPSFSATAYKGGSPSTIRIGISPEGL